MKSIIRHPSQPSQSKEKPQTISPCSPKRKRDIFVSNKCTNWIESDENIRINIHLTYFSDNGLVTSNFISKYIFLVQLSVNKFENDFCLLNYCLEFWDESLLSSFNCSRHIGQVFFICSQAKRHSPWNKWRLPQGTFLTSSPRL